MVIIIALYGIIKTLTEKAALTRDICNIFDMCPVGSEDTHYGQIHLARTTYRRIRIVFHDLSLVLVDS